MPTRFSVETLPARVVLAISLALALLTPAGLALARPAAASAGRRATHSARTHVRRTKHRAKRHARPKHHNKVNKRTTAKKTASKTTPVTQPSATATTGAGSASTPTSTSTGQTGGISSGGSTITPNEPAPTSSGDALFTTAYPASGDASDFGVTGWGHVQYPSDDGVPQPDRIEFGPAPGSAEDPFKPNTNVARFELEPYYINGEPNGDITDTGGYLANRVEVYDRIADHATPAADWPDPVGSTRWYSFSIYIPPNFPEATSSSQWFDFVQWKGFNTGSPPVAMEIRHNEFVLGGANSDQHLATIVPGQWTQFVIGLHFSDSATTGWETAYVDNKPIVRHRPTATMRSYYHDGEELVDPNYLKMGIYRSVTWTVTQVIYLSPMTITAMQPQ